MRQRLNYILVIIISISILLRVFAAIYLGDQVVILPGIYDQISYHNLALRVLNGHGFTFGETWWPMTAAGAPTAHWSYLYTSFLVVVYALFGPHPLAARLIQAVLIGVLQPYLVYRIGRLLFSNVVGLIAAGLTAVYTYFVYYAAALMTESFYITAILGVIFVAMLLVDRVVVAGGNKSRVRYRYLFIVLGLTLGLIVLLRQLFLLFIPFLFLWIWWASYKRGGRSLASGLLFTTVIIVVLILPFTIYNYIRFGRFVLLNTNAGFALFWANHPIYGTNFEPILPSEMGSYQSLIPDDLRHLDEAALDQALLKRGFQFILDEPVRYVKLSISRIPAYFNFWYSSESGLISNIARMTSFGLLWPFMLYGVLLSISRDIKSINFLTSPSFLLYIFIGFYTALHLLIWALIRYRLPVDAVLVIFAGYALFDIYSRIKLRRIQVITPN